MIISQILVCILIFGLMIYNICGICGFDNKRDYEKCYNEKEKEGTAVFGMCCGISGCNKDFDYLNEKCVDCPYLDLILRENDD